AGPTRGDRPRHLDRTVGRVRRRTDRGTRQRIDREDDVASRIRHPARQRRPGGRHPRSPSRRSMRRADLDPGRTPRGGSVRHMFTLVMALLRGGGRRTALDLGLTVVGTAIPVAITLLVVGTVTGFQEREDAMAWREPTAVADAEASALQLRRYEPWRGERIDVVEFRSLGPDAPVPPGMDRFPSPGEIWVSPALERLLDSEEASALLPSRLGGAIAGVLGPEAISPQDELVAVVGNPDLEETPPEDLPGLDHRILGGDR